MEETKNKPARAVTDLAKALEGSGLPNLKSLLGASLPHFEQPQDPNLASEFYMRLRRQVQAFEASLDPNHEVAVTFANFGHAITIHVAQIGYWNPSLILFKGSIDEGRNVELIQHVSQLNVLLTSVPRLDPSQPKRRIGFTVIEPETK